MSVRGYIFIGPPGSGKGTLSRLCIDRFGWAQLSTGNLCRKHISNQTAIGKQIDQAIKAGQLMSDDLITAMVDSSLQDITRASRTVLFDGFPRTAVQAENLYKLIKNKYPTLQLSVIRFIISDESSINRICSRFVCKNSDCQTVYSGNKHSGLGPKVENYCDVCNSQLLKRSDDSQETVAQRLRLYRKHERLLLDYFATHEHTVHEVDAEQAASCLFDTFIGSIAQKE